MRLVVVGATGGTGPFVLREALARGHNVTAFARRPEALSDIAGPAAVVDAGRPRRVRGRQSDQRTRRSDRDRQWTWPAGCGPRCSSHSDRGNDGAGCGTPRCHQRLRPGGDQAVPARRPGPPDLRQPFADQSAADEVIEASEVDWTIARATCRVDKPSSRPARISPDLVQTGPYSISRQAWATVLVNVAEHGTHRRQIVNVTG
jgi:NAD(P)H-binding